MLGGLRWRGGVEAGIPGAGKAGGGECGGGKE